jgi:hypothetical protein
MENQDQNLPQGMHKDWLFQHRRFLLTLVGLFLLAGLLFNFKIEYYRRNIYVDRSGINQQTSSLRAMQVYINSDYGFELDFPKTTKVTQVTSQKYEISGERFFASLEIKPGKIQKEFFWGPGGEVVKLIETNVNSRLWYTNPARDGGGANWTDYQTQVGSNILTIIFPEIASGVFDDPDAIKNEAYFNRALQIQILSSFREFLLEDGDMRTYTNETTLAECKNKPEEQQNSLDCKYVYSDLFFSPKFDDYSEEKININGIEWNVSYGEVSGHRFEYRNKARDYGFQAGYEQKQKLIDILKTFRILE